MRHKYFSNHKSQQETHSFFFLFPGRMFLKSLKAIQKFMSLLSLSWAFGRIKCNKLWEKTDVDLTHEWIDGHSLPWFKRKIPKWGDSRSKIKVSVKETEVKLVIELYWPSETQLRDRRLSGFWMKKEMRQSWRGAERR